MIKMSEWDLISSSVETVGGSGGVSNTTPIQTSSTSSNEEEKDAFVSTSDLSSVLLEPPTTPQSPQSSIKTSNRKKSSVSTSDSNNSSSCSFNTNSNSSNSNSNSSSSSSATNPPDNSSISNSNSINNNVNDLTKEVIEPNSGLQNKSSLISPSSHSTAASPAASPAKLEESVVVLEEGGDPPVFDKCSATASLASSSNPSGEVQRSGSMSVIKSTPSSNKSFDESQKSSPGGKEEENSLAGFAGGGGGLEETFHTPSTSNHNISASNQNRKYSLQLLHQNDYQKSSSSQSEPIVGSPKESEESKQEMEIGGEEENLKSEDGASLYEEARGESDVLGELKESCSSGGGGVGSLKEEYNTPPVSKGVVSSRSSISSSGRKPMKKKNWFGQMFTPSYKSRSGDFKKLFKELPPKERLLVDYSCALQKEILVQGRMYVSQGFISFHANIFGWETQTSIRLRDISAITKEKTALVIPNAIQIISAPGDKYFFTSFVTRDSTFLMLFKLWQSALLEDGMPAWEMERLINLAYGEEFIITESEDEEEEELPSKPIPQVCASDIGPALAVSGALGSNILTSKALIGASSELLACSNVVEEEEKEEEGRGGLLQSDLSDTSDSEEDDFQVPSISVQEEEEVQVPLCPVPHSEGKENLNATFPCNIDQLFTMLFTNSKFYLDLHTSRNTFNVRQSEWEIEGSKKTRVVSMTVSLSGVMGPKHSHVTETQVMQSVSRPGLFYAIDSESVNAGIPYADSFFVTVHYCLSRLATNQTKLIILNQIKYKKSVWGITKSIIEKNCWAGMEEFYSHLERALQEECVKMSVGTSPLPSPKHCTGSLPRRRPPNKKPKGKAPDIPPGMAPPLSSTHSTLRNGSIPSSMSGGPGSGLTMSSGMLGMNEGSPSSRVEESQTLKIILTVLAALLLLNAFLYFKLSWLETAASSPSFISPQTFTFTGELPQSHADWLLLLQKQERLHRIELQNWHEILISALKVLQQAETDLQVLKGHISTYGDEGSKFTIEKPEVGPSLPDDPVEVETAVSEEGQSQGQSQKDRDEM